MLNVILCFIISFKQAAKVPLSRTDLARNCRLKKDGIQALDSKALSSFLQGHALELESMEAAQTMMESILLHRVETRKE